MDMYGYLAQYLEEVAGKTESGDFIQRYSLTNDDARWEYRAEKVLAECDNAALAEFLKWFKVDDGVVKVRSS